MGKPVFHRFHSLFREERAQMGPTLLRALMVICALADEWKDPSKIPVSDIMFGAS